MKLLWKGTNSLRSESDLIAEILATEDEYLRGLFVSELESKHEIYDFENGFGASSVYLPSIIQNSNYWEIVLIKFDSDDVLNSNYSLIGDPYKYHREDLEIELQKLKSESEKLLLKKSI